MATEKTSWNNGVRTSVTTRSASPFSTRAQRGLAPRQRGGSNLTPVIMVGLVIVGGILAYFLVVKPLLEAAGLKETKYDEELPKKNGFNPEYYKNNIGKVTISTQKAFSIAQKVFMASGWADRIAGRGTVLIPSNDDEELLQGAIQEAGSEYNLSKVSDTFQKTYGVGMIAWIKDFADNSDTKAISRIIKEYRN